MEAYYLECLRAGLKGSEREDIKETITLHRHVKRSWCRLVWRWTELQRPGDGWETSLDNFHKIPVFGPDNLMMMNGEMYCALKYIMCVCEWGLWTCTTWCSPVSWLYLRTWPVVIDQPLLTIFWEGHMWNNRCLPRQSQHTAQARISGSPMTGKTLLPSQD